jgi:hypothetical protein
MIGSRWRERLNWRRDLGARPCVLDLRGGGVPRAANRTGHASEGISQGAIVTETVRSWFEFQLIEVVLAARALKGSSPLWTSTDVESILTPRALTAVVLPRFHVDQIVGRTLGTRIMSLDRARQLAGAQSAGVTPSVSSIPGNGEAIAD